MANYNDIKNDLADRGYSDDAGELTDLTENTFESNHDFFNAEFDYFADLEYPYTEEIPEELTYPGEKKDERAGDYFPFVVLSQSGIELCYGYTDNRDNVAVILELDGRAQEPNVGPKAYKESIVRKWVKERVEDFVNRNNHEPYLQKKFNEWSNLV